MLNIENQKIEDMTKYMALTIGISGIINTWFSTSLLLKDHRLTQKSKSFEIPNQKREDLPSSSSSSRLASLSLSRFPGEF